MRKIYLLITALVAMSLQSLAAPANVAPADSSGTIVIDNATTLSMTGYVGAMALNTQVVTVRWHDAEIPPQPPVVYELMSVGGGIGDYSVSITGDDCFTAFVIYGDMSEKRCKVRIGYNPRECGTHHATLTVKCERAWYDVVITLEGTATLLKNDPVMSDPIATEAESCLFVARWHHNCSLGAVESYTLECAPAGTGFDSQASRYIVLDGLLPEDCQSYGGMLLQIGRYVKVIDSLDPGEIYDYRVRAYYIDGTRSRWSNVQTVTLPAADLPPTPGDVNRDGALNVTDAIRMISCVINEDLEGVSIPRADLNSDGIVNVTDISLLISTLIGESR